MSRANSGAFSANERRVRGEVAHQRPPRRAAEAAHALGDVGEKAAARLLAVVADVDPGVELPRDTGACGLGRGRARSPASTGSPRLFRTNIAFSASGRGRLPAWVVRIRVSLYRMARLFQIRATDRNCGNFVAGSARGSGEWRHARKDPGGGSVRGLMCVLIGPGRIRRHHHPACAGRGRGTLRVVALDLHGPGVVVDGVGLTVLSATRSRSTQRTRRSAWTTADSSRTRWATAAMLLIYSVLGQHLSSGSADRVLLGTFRSPSPYYTGFRSVPELRPPARGRPLRLHSPRRPLPRS